MSVDARIREGLTMIDKQLPVVDSREGFEELQSDIRRDTRRRRALVGAAAAVLVVTGGAVLLNRSSDDEAQPAPPPPLPSRVTFFDEGGGVSTVGDDGSVQPIARHADRFALSQDGRQIAYISYKPDSGSGRSLWVADADGSHRHRLEAPCAGCQPGFGVAWSHDGTRLAYTVFTPGQKPAQLRVRTIATGDERVLKMPAGFDARGPQFSPDDQTLAINLAGDGEEYLATIDPDEGVSSLARLSRAYSQVQLPSWSADGRTVYFTATTSGDGNDDPAAQNDLYAVDVDGGNLRQITHAALGERFFGVLPYRDRFLISRAVGRGPLVMGWLSDDGSTFTPMTDADGKPLRGSGAQLQP